MDEEITTTCPYFLIHQAKKKAVASFTTFIILLICLRGKVKFWIPREMFSKEKK